MSVKKLRENLADLKEKYLDLTLTTKSAIENAVEAVLDKGLRTADIYTDGTTKASTKEMGEAVLAELKG